jgi:hypothetical protein
VLTSSSPRPEPVWIAPLKRRNLGQSGVFAGAGGGVENPRQADMIAPGWSGSVRPSRFLAAKERFRDHRLRLVRVASGGWVASSLPLSGGRPVRLRGIRPPSAALPLVPVPQLGPRRAAERQPRRSPQSCRAVGIGDVAGERGDRAPLVGRLQLDRDAAAQPLRPANRDQNPPSARSSMNWFDVLMSGKIERS